MPSIIDFATHILAHMETHASLLTKSGMVRVDIGVEFWKGEGELSDSAAPWSAFKHDERTIYARFILNEVTTSTDINLFMVSKLMLIGSVISGLTNVLRLIDDLTFVNLTVSISSYV